VSHGGRGAAGPAHQRRGQGQWRDHALVLESRCRTTGVEDPRLLVANHILPWRPSTSWERLDPNNGTIVTSHVDAPSDKGLISFADDGSLLLSPLLDLKTLEQLRIPADASTGPSRGAQSTDLARQRLGVFQR
jgi:hypothetical protein